MATCPYCGDYLSEGHRCLRKELRMARTAGAALSGRAVGYRATSAVFEHHPALLLATTGLLGALLVTAVWLVTRFGALLDSGANDEDYMAGDSGKNLFRQFPYTSVALALALMVVVAAMFGDINAFDLPGVDVLDIEPNETDAIVMAFLLVIPVLFAERAAARQRTHDAQLVGEQLRVLRVTMRTVQDIVNNNLNQLQLLRIEADGLVPDETLALFDNALRDTAAQLTALGNMKVFAEKPMASGPGLDVLAKE
jgi:hypothetical protein